MIPEQFDEKLCYVWISLSFVLKKKKFLGMDSGWNSNSQAIIPQKNSLQRKLKQNVECELSPCTEQMLVNRSCLPEEVAIRTQVCWSIFYCRYLACYYRFVRVYKKKKLAIVVLLVAANVISGNNGNFHMYRSLPRWERKKKWRNNNAGPLWTCLEMIIIEIVSSTTSRTHFLHSYLFVYNSHVST